jgi:hypothetical protein
MKLKRMIIPQEDPALFLLGLKSPRSNAQL